MLVAKSLGCNDGISLGVTDELFVGEVLGSALGDSLGLLKDGQEENSAVTAGSPQVSPNWYDETMFPYASISCTVELERRHKHSSWDSFRQALFKITTLSISSTEFKSTCHH